MYVINAEGFVQDDEDDDDELCYVREKPATYTPATASVTFNMKKYGINLRGDGQMVYVPLITLSDMYSDLDDKHVFFNGDASRLYDGGHTLLSPVMNCAIIGITDLKIIDQYAEKFITSFVDDYPF